MQPACYPAALCLIGIGGCAWGSGSVSREKVGAGTVSRREASVAESELFERGLALRRDVLGAEYVDTSIDGADEFLMSFPAGEW